MKQEDRFLCVWWAFACHKSVNQAHACCPLRPEECWTLELELQLQAAMWVLGTKPCSSGIAASILNC